MMRRIVYPHDRWVLLGRAFQDQPLHPHDVVLSRAAEAVSSALSVGPAGEGASAEFKGETDSGDACDTLGDCEFTKLDHSPASWDGSHHGGDLTALKALAAVNQSFPKGIVGIHMGPPTEAAYRSLCTSKGFGRRDSAVLDRNMSPNTAG